MMKRNKSVKRLKPISLYPLPVEDAIKAIFQSPPIPTKKRGTKKKNKGNKKRK